MTVQLQRARILQVQGDSAATEGQDFPKELKKTWVVNIQGLGRN